MLDLCHIYRRWLYSRFINAYQTENSLCTTIVYMSPKGKNVCRIGYCWVFLGYFSPFELTEYGFVLYNQFSEVSLENFHRVWKSSISFGQRFYILEDAPYSTGSFIDDEDLIWFDLRLCHLIGLFTGEPITSKNTF